MTSLPDKAKAFINSRLRQDRCSNRFDISVCDEFRNITEKQGVIPITAVDQFVDGIPFRPTLKDNAVHSTDQAGAIGAVPAVDQNRPFPIADNAERFYHLSRGYLCGPDFDPVKFEACRRQVIVGVKFTQVENSADIEGLQPSLLKGLISAAAEAGKPVSSKTTSSIGEMKYNMGVTRYRKDRTFQRFNLTIMSSGLRKRLHQLTILHSRASTNLPIFTLYKHFHGFTVKTIITFCFLG